MMRQCKMQLSRRVKLEFHEPTPTRTPTPTLGMRLSCNFVNVYTIAYRVHARIPNGHPCEDPREKRACRKSADIS